MKGVWKFLGAAAVMLLVVGFILIGIGVSTVGWSGMGQVVNQMSKGMISFENGIRIANKDLTDLGKLVEKNAIFNIDDVDNFHKSHEVWKGNVKKTKITKENVEKLNLELGGCMFEIKTSSDDTYYVEYNGTGKSQAYAKGEELYVKVLNSDATSFGKRENLFTLYVPQGVEFDKMDVDLGAGQVTFDEVMTKELNVELGAGQILSKGLKAENVFLSIGAGGISLTDAKLKEIEIKVGAGNCEIDGMIAEKVKAECSMGNISLKIGGCEEDFDYDIECVSGNITIAGVEYAGLAKEKEIDNHADKKMKLDCVMGNIEVTFQ